MKNLLTMDDIRVGMFVTVFRGEIYQVSNVFSSNVITSEKSNLNGEVLEVIALDMPYALVKHYKLNTQDTNKIEFTKKVIDLRNYLLMRLSKNYITTYCPGLDCKKDIFWDDIEDAFLENIDANLKDIFDDINKK